jgi:hypothetical protein
VKVKRRLSAVAAVAVKSSVRNNLFFIAARLAGVRRRRSRSYVKGCRQIAIPCQNRKPTPTNSKKIGSVTFGFVAIFPP